MNINSDSGVSWPGIAQNGCKNCILDSKLEEEVYMKQYEDKVYRLQKALYKPKQFKMKDMSEAKYVLDIKYSYAIFEISQF